MLKSLCFCYLDAYRVKNHLIQSGDVEMKNRESQALKPSHHFEELSRAFLGQDFEVGMGIHHGDFDISGGPLGVGTG